MDKQYSNQNRGEKLTERMMTTPVVWPGDKKAFFTICFSYSPFQGEGQKHPISFRIKRMSLLW
ncbi:hypothetical protein CO726_13355 [Bacillus fungorum]|uniref:Uncharacterized protein n=1 Tax=Bacillus fungorum TaxID=2039284 RepID=A0A2G6QCM6_9BACI|nr:hypothetical protein CO726_13355 [Bacillus fungorum]